MLKKRGRYKSCLLAMKGQAPPGLARYCGLRSVRCELEIQSCSPEVFLIHRSLHGRMDNYLKQDIVHSSHQVLVVIVIEHMFTRIEAQL
jgi:hypothetical protein